MGCCRRSSLLSFPSSSFISSTTIASCSVLPFLCSLGTPLFLSASSAFRHLRFSLSLLSSSPPCFSILSSSTIHLYLLLFLLTFSSLSYPLYSCPYLLACLPIPLRGAAPSSDGLHRLFPSLFDFVKNALAPDFLRSFPFKHEFYYYVFLRR